MRTTLMLITIIILAASSPVYSAGYTLKRAVITWDDGSTDDSALNTFQATGTMTITNNTITQNITFCSAGICDKVVDNESGTVLSLSANSSRATLRRNDDGTVGDLTLLTLSPNIITLFVYEDGTAEIHEWKPTNPLAKRTDAAPESGNTATNHTRGSVGTGIARALRP